VSPGLGRQISHLRCSLCIPALAACLETRASTAVPGSERRRYDTLAHLVRRTLGGPCVRRRWPAFAGAFTWLIPAQKSGHYSRAITSRELLPLALRPVPRSVNLHLTLAGASGFYLVFAHIRLWSPICTALDRKEV